MLIATEPFGRRQDVHDAAASKLNDVGVLARSDQRKLHDVEDLPSLILVPVARGGNNG